MSNYLRIKAIMDADEPTFGALDDAAAAAEFNNENKSYDLPSMTGKQVKDAFIDHADEWAAVGALGRDRQLVVLSLCARDDLDPHGVDADIFTDACGGAAPVTVNALNTARTIITSTAFINGLGEVKAIHVTYARAIG